MAFNVTKNEVDGVKTVTVTGFHALIPYAVVLAVGVIVGALL